MNQISEQQANKVTAINENFEALKPAELFGVDRSLSVGLVFAYYGGILHVNGVQTTIAAGTVALTGSTTNYIERTLAGVVSANTTGFSADRIPLYTATTTSVGISSLTDYRQTNFEATGRLSKSVAGSGDVTLTAAEARNRILHLTGVLTGNRNVIVPAMVRDFIVFNATSGAFSLTVKTAAGSGVAVTQSSTTGAALSCDGTDVLVVGSAGSGEVNTASNIGSAGVGVFAQKVGADLQFRKIESGHPALTISDADSPDDQVVFGLEEFVGDDPDSPAPDPQPGLVPAPAAGDAAAGKFLKADKTWAVPPGGSGEVNTASNIGNAGVGLFAQKVGTDLQFRKIESGHPALTISDADSPDDQVVLGLEEFVGDSEDSPAADPKPGLVPAPAAGDAAAGKFLGADGAWNFLSGSFRSINLNGDNNAITPNSQYDIAADYLVLTNGSGGALFDDSPGSVTVDISTAGPAAGGRDQAGSFSNSSWVHMYRIWGVGQSRAGIASTADQSVGPALPSGYTHWCYVGAIRINSSGNLVRTIIKGIWCTYAASVAVVSSGTATTETSISMSAVVPPNASMVNIQSLLSNTNSVSNQLNLRVISGSNVYNPVVGVGNVSQAWVAATGILPNVNQTFYYLLTQTGGALFLNCLGYSIPNGAV